MYDDSSSHEMYPTTAGIGRGSPPPGKRTLTGTIQRRQSETAPVAPAVSEPQAPAVSSADPFWFCDAAPMLEGEEEHGSEDETALDTDGPLQFSLAEEGEEPVHDDGVDEAEEEQEDDSDVDLDPSEALSETLASPAGDLPYLDIIQASFGEGHDLSGIKAHVGGTAEASCAVMGAEAYATGDHVAFASPPDLHTAAHEAAHVVQQARGVHLYGGIGQAGDEYGLQADAVADRVVAGQSAADLLGPETAHRADPGPVVQHRGGDKEKKRKKGK